MVRLIDADAIEHCLVIGGRRHGKTIISEIIRRAIQTAPTVDAVPVIRCKDCKYYLKSNEECQLIKTRLHFYETDKKWFEDSFCAWAERKDKNDSCQSV